MKEMATLDIACTRTATTALFLRLELAALSRLRQVRLSVFAAERLHIVQTVGIPS